MRRGTWFATIVFCGFGSTARAQSVDITKSENWPCDTCHPTNAAEGGELAHDQTLGDGHVRHGKTRKACLTCHASDAHPEQLLALDGKTVPIESGVPETCERCHFDRYDDWKMAYHGKHLKCSNPQCHNPHAPATLQISLAPFGPDKVPLQIGRKREKAIQALPAVVGGPPHTGAPGVGAVAACGLVVFIVLALFALKTVSRKRGES